MGFPELNRAVLEGMEESERGRVFARVSQALSDQLMGAADFDTKVSEIIRELENQGHDLCMFDADFDVDFDKGETSQLWCGDWTSGGASTQLIIWFLRGKALSWSGVSDLLTFR